jgi:hypothetical protein
MNSRRQLQSDVWVLRSLLKKWSQKTTDQSLCILGNNAVYKSVLDCFEERVVLVYKSSADFRATSADVVKYLADAHRV